MAAVAVISSLLLLAAIVRISVVSLLYLLGFLCLLHKPRYTVQSGSHLTAAGGAAPAAVEVVATEEGVAPEVSPVPSLSSEAAGASFAGGFAEAARLAASSSPRRFFFARRASLAWRDCSTNAG